MHARAYTMLLVIFVGLVSNAQDENVSVPADSTVLVEETLVQTDFISPTLFHRLYGPYLSYPAYSDYLYGQSLVVSPYFYDRNEVMPHIGNLGGYVTSTSLPGLMGIESGSLSYSFNSDNFSFTPAVYVNKYGYFGGLTTSLGIGGQIDFSINDRFSVTAFGAYYTNSWSANPAVMSNMQSSRYGAYGTWNINDRWSLSAGAQRVYNSATNQWQTVPIVMPTYKINGKASIGVDVGGLLYQIVDWNRNRHGYGTGNPTIGPPERPQIVFPPYGN